jgi:hypothetical protein
MCVLFNEAVQRRPLFASISLQRCWLSRGHGQTSDDRPRHTSSHRPLRVLPLSPMFPGQPARGDGPEQTPLIRCLSPSAYSGRVAPVRCSQHPDDPASALRRSNRLEPIPPGPIAMALPAAARPCGFSLSRRPRILRPIVLCVGRLYWIAGVSTPLATGHAPPSSAVNTVNTDDVPLPVRQAGHGLARRGPQGHRTYRWTVEDRVPATLLGFRPSQCCSCP